MEGGGWDSKELISRSTISPVWDRFQPERPAATLGTSSAALHCCYFGQPLADHGYTRLGQTLILLTNMVSAGEPAKPAEEKLAKLGQKYPSWDKA